MKQLLAFLSLTIFLCTGCARAGAWREVARLPYHEEVGTITQYKNFIRGGYRLSPQVTHVLSMEWREEGAVEVYLEREDGYREILEVQSGIPCEFAVTQDDLYQIRLPLDGVEMSGLTFSLAAQS